MLFIVKYCIWLFPDGENFAFLSLKRKEMSGYYFAHCRVTLTYTYIVHKEDILDENAQNKENHNNDLRSEKMFGNGIHIHIHITMSTKKL